MRPLLHFHYPTILGLDSDGHTLATLAAACGCTGNNAAQREDTCTRNSSSTNAKTTKTLAGIFAWPLSSMKNLEIDTEEYEC